MAFTGTLDKCNACGKTVYFVELLSADGITYHKSCFRCSRCRGTLGMSNYHSMDGTLYCKPHYEQLLKEIGFTKNINKPKERQLTRTPSKLSYLFTGTQEKCTACHKTVYPLEKMTLEEEPFHKSCFKCAHGGCPLTHSSYSSLNGILYCKPHFSQLFMEKGTYSHVLEAAKIRSTVVPVEPEESEESENKTDEADEADEAED